MDESKYCSGIFAPHGLSFISCAMKQINNMIGYTRTNNGDARAARTLVHFFDVVCQIATRNF